MPVFKVKFFGSKEASHEPIRKIKEVIDAKDKEHVFENLSKKYKRIDSLKIHDITESFNNTRVEDLIK